MTLGGLWKIFSRAIMRCIGFGFCRVVHVLSNLGGPFGIIQPPHQYMMKCTKNINMLSSVGNCEVEINKHLPCDWAHHLIEELKFDINYDGQADLPLAMRCWAFFSLRLIIHTDFLECSFKCAKECILIAFLKFVFMYTVIL